jgi:stage V sporulation protein SpoVS
MKTLDKKFDDESVDAELTNLLQTTSENDIKTISFPAGVAKAIKEVEELRQYITPSRINEMFVPECLEILTKLYNGKFAIGKQLATMIQAHGYGYIYRKFKTANEYNPTKERLEKLRPDKRPTVDEIDSEIEKNLVTIRKTEVAYQSVADKMNVILNLCNDMMWTIKSRITQATKEQSTQSADDGSVREPKQGVIAGMPRHRA